MSIKHIPFVLFVILSVLSCKKDEPSGSQPEQPEQQETKATLVLLNKNELSLATGLSEMLVATVATTDASEMAASWTSSNASVATVSNDGKVTGVSKGNTTITAKAGDKSASCEVTVYGDCLYYTSADGQTVVPANKDAFGAEIFANLYENGKGRIVFKDAVKVIGNDAFKDCSNLQGIEIPSGITDIGENAFSGTGLTSIVFPSSLESIGKGAFVSCKNLQDVELPVVTMGTGVFKYCDALTSAMFTSGWTEIPWATFYDCKNLETVTLPPTIEHIGESAFDGCESLLAVDIPHVTQIDREAFRRCSSLKSLSNLPSIKRIEYFAFFGCSLIEEFYFGEDLTFIGDAVFGECAKLKSVTILAMDPPTLGAWAGGTFTFYVPAEAVNAYKEDWGIIGNYVEPIPE